MERWEAKVLAIIITIILMLLSVFAPFKMVAKFKKLGRLGTRILDTLGCFTGGIFLGTCLLFLVPEVVSLMHRPENSGSFPLAEFVMAVGFVVIMFLERIVHSCRKNESKKKKKKKMKMKKKTNSFPPPSPSPLDRTGTAGDDEEENSVETSQLRSGYHGNGGVLYTGSVEKSADDDDDDDEAAAGEDAAEEPISNSMLSVVGESEEILATEGVTRAVILFVALSLDEFLGGVSMGLQRTTTAVWGILVGLLAHECVVGFSFGLQLAGLSESRPGCFSYALGLSYALVGPLGAVVGTLIGETSEPSEGIDFVNGILQGLATGVFLYVTFFEILGGKVHSRSPYVDLLAVAAGIGVMALIATVPKEDPTSRHDGNATTSATFAAATTTTFGLWSNSRSPL